MEQESGSIGFYKNPIIEGRYADLNLYSVSENVKSAIERNKLAAKLEGYSDSKPMELGINFDIKPSSDGTIPKDVIKKASEHLIGRTFKCDRLLEVNLNNSQIYSRDDSVKMVVRIPQGESYGIIRDKYAERNVVLSDKVSLKPIKVTVRKILGKDALFVDADVVRQTDFENSKTINWCKDVYKDYRLSLNSDQVSALSLYVKNDYKNINSYLRTGQLPEGQTQEGIDKRINDISSALAVKPLPEDMTLYRRAGENVFGYESTAKYILTFDEPKKFMNEKKESIEEFREKWLGKEFNDKGFMSTSLSCSNITAFQNGRFIFRIHAEKGSNAAYVSIFEGFEGEKEILLDKNSLLKIYRITPIKELIANRKIITKMLIDATLVQNKTLRGEYMANAQGLMGYYFKDKFFSEMRVILATHLESSYVLLGPTKLESLDYFKDQKSSAVRWIGSIRVNSGEGKYKFSTDSPNCILRINGVLFQHSSSAGASVKLVPG